MSWGKPGAHVLAPSIGLCKVLELVETSAAGPLYRLEGLEKETKGMVYTAIPAIHCRVLPRPLVAVSIIREEVEIKRERKPRKRGGDPTT